MFLKKLVISEQLKNGERSWDAQEIQFDSGSEQLWSLRSFSGQPVVLGTANTQKQRPDDPMIGTAPNKFGNGV